MTEIMLFDGDFGIDVMYLRCDLTRAESNIQWRATRRDDWVSSQYQCADAYHSNEGMYEIGKQIAAVALELPSVECNWKTL